MKSRFLFISLMGIFLYAAVVLAAAVHPAGHVRVVLGTATNSLVGTGTYATLATSTSAISEVQIFESGSNKYVFGTGYTTATATSVSTSTSTVGTVTSTTTTTSTATGTVVSDLVNVPAGGLARFPLAAPPSTKFYLKALDANATSGEVDVNFFK